MVKQIRTSSVSGARSLAVGGPHAVARAVAALDRSTWLQWQPSRGFQLGDALVAAVLRHPGVHPITKRVSQNVR